MRREELVWTLLLLRLLHLAALSALVTEFGIARCHASNGRLLEEASSYLCCGERDEGMRANGLEACP